MTQIEKYIIVITRFWEFNYYQNFFLQHYKKFANEIHIWIEKDYKLKFSKIKPNIKIFKYPFIYKFSSDNEFKQINYIYFNELNQLNFKNYKSVLLIFVDEDEIFNINELRLIKNTINYSCFFEWYLPYNEKDVNFKNFYLLSIHKKLKGKILEAWNDPFYKTNILMVNRENINYLKKCSFTTGFHRLICNKKLPKKYKNCVIGYHFKGIPLNYLIKRYFLIQKKIINKNDIFYQHYKILQNLIKDYKQHYKHLKSYNYLKTQLELLKVKSLKFTYFDKINISQSKKLKKYVQDICCLWNKR